MQKKNVSKEAIINAALEILREQGLSHVTMRNVAARLKIKAPALYWYIKNKQELLELLGEYIACQFTFPKECSSWEEEVELFSLELRRVLLSVPDGAEIMMVTLPVTKQRLLLINRTFAIFHRSGLREDKIFQAVNFINTYVTSYVLDEQKQQRMLEEIGFEAVQDKFSEAIAALSKAEAPYIYHHFLSPNEGLKSSNDFLSGLKVIIKGLQQLH
ncbi:TetR/AcrR family transcriptional regulator C-terminal domain-containing protein [Niallia taxi]|uniref:TetR/AcrR family transcriptional regulator C-terminal domain-containing protein n=1 Tax=Niallia taxi TaxID=2499688 RepID=UPI0011A8051E|nr:TetR/AcrR family transcriptional regulator C-terminal domain-containing protein [Niallia taxi]MCT2344839.1 TetR/AcrR family transcriptional regulator C-terminal domain-containing protein [Niallia taxi]MDE5054972.1 TetR/AcrR family transcriptional regulator C-terminal domain-containing protein [Niallia taxi]MED3961554.1 TetR/AcrR family transcriptional regulator C-terminal domain-containing protein [Niallia taxi]WOD63797.1 TetR/AcrR family transcriptional regulator C-terminal domain-containin